MMELEKQQEVLMNLADMAIDVFAAESAILRTEKLIAMKSDAECEMQIAMTKCFVNDAMERVYVAGKHAITAFAEDDMLVMMHMGLKRFTKYPMTNTIALRKKVAEKIISENVYCF
jgi:hypothetical protein